MHYRVGLVVWHMGWVDFVLDTAPFCPVAQPIQPYSHLSKQNRAGSAMT